MYSGLVAAVLAAVVLPANGMGEIPDDARSADPAWPVSQPRAGTFAASQQDSPTPFDAFISEALQNNPEIQAALWEREAARTRISPAEALDDPVLEAGVLYAPLTSSPFNREDMTMKMIGLSQRLPFPGKRGLRRVVAARDAEAIDHGYAETVNRVAREIKVAYFELGLVLEMIRLVEKNKLILEEFLHIAEDHYGVGRGNQIDVLKAQTQVSRMTDQLLRLVHEQRAAEAELVRALGRDENVGPPIPAALKLREEILNLESLRETAVTQRPRLLALQSLVARNEKAFELAKKNYYPDFDVRTSYGQRENALDGANRPDMVSLTVAINLPVWRRNKLEPREAEALALRDQALNLYHAQRNEIAARLREQVAAAAKNLESAQLYQNAILPQARLTVESALAAYQVNRSDFLMLLDSQMTVFNYEISLARAVASYNQALAEIDLLTGKPPINQY